MTKKTFGQVVNELGPINEIDDDIREYSKAMGKDTFAELHKIAFEACKKDVYKNKNFYIVTGIVTEAFTRKKFPKSWARLSCPTPIYNQIVHKYHYLSGELEYLWTIPDQGLYWLVYKDATRLLADKETRNMAQFVCLMESGELEKWVIKENGNKPDGLITINKENECQINY